MTFGRLRKFMESQGFEHGTVPGFVEYRRTHPDGREQVIHVFRWSNPKHAAAAGIPAGYFVFTDDSGSGGTGINGRVILPLWEIGEAEKRPWDAVEAELRDVIAPLWELPAEDAYEYGVEMNDFPRYQISR